MTHQVDIIEVHQQTDKVTILKTSVDYFDKILAVESKDLKFYLEKRKQSIQAENHDNWMYCYFFEVCPHQQDLQQLAKNLNKTLDELKDIMDTELPPRIPQNVHGYFQLGSQRRKMHDPTYEHYKLPTRLDFCNHWDKNTVSSSMFMTDEGPKEGQFVCFYAIDCQGQQVKPVEIFPKPRAIRASYDIVKKTSDIEEVDHKAWLGKPFYKASKMDEDNPIWPKVSMIKGLFEDLPSSK